MSKRGPRRNPGRLMNDLIISTRLGMAEPDMRDAPGRVFVGGRELPQTDSVSQAAKDLAAEWEAQGYHVSWQSIRARYNKLEKMRKNFADGVSDKEYLKKSL